jgi:hypothetical protein
MGVRFPQADNRPNFSEMQRSTSVTRQDMEQTQSPGQTARATQANLQPPTREVPELSRQEEQPAIQRLAQNAGSQTPGSFIDLLA